MCAIWTVLLEALKGRDLSALRADFEAIAGRGPDRKEWLELSEIGAIVGFHRLSIMDPTEAGDQPFILTDGPLTAYLTCNGEIYNWRELAAEHGLELESKSDCEVLLKLWQKFDRDLEAVSKLIRGVFAIVLVEANAETGEVKLSATRDRFGVRPMFLGWGVGPEGGLELGLFSELKAGLRSFANEKPFPPGHCLRFTRGGFPAWSAWFALDEAVPRLPPRENGALEAPLKEAALAGIRLTLEEAVRSRLCADREMGFLLSGGLDSSLVAAIGAKAAKEAGQGPIRTFCIGTEDSTDSRWAQAVADHIGSIHTRIPFKVEEALEAIPAVIWSTESYDITTIRASVGQYLVSKWVAENTAIKVLLLGDGADEVAMGYIYTQNFPSLAEAHLDTVRLLRQIHCYDVLRADRAVSCHGLETRVPFLDQEFVDFFLGLPVEWRVPRDGFTKAIIREAFEDSGLLPKDAIWRKKEAFSDGVSSTADSWHSLVQRWAAAKVSDEDWARLHWTFSHNTPRTKEALYYRLRFQELFQAEGRLDHVVPAFWLPRWSGTVHDPSARVLKHYHKE